MGSGAYPVPGEIVPVLVAEDDAGTRKFICATLRTEGYAVLEAESGPAALEVLERRKVEPMLLIADFIMPGMNGGDLAGKVREKHPDARVLFISGHIEETHVQEGVMDGARRLSAHFLAKPFTDEELARKVRAVMLAP
ncbi:MAG: response regulator [Planctomycetota bacterium]|jgi:CheY-like chemotaxis protein